MASEQNGLSCQTGMWCSEPLMMWEKIGASWEVQIFKQEGEIPHWLGAFLVLCLSGCHRDEELVMLGCKGGNGWHEMCDESEDLLKHTVEAVQVNRQAFECQGFFGVLGWRERWTTSVFSDVLQAFPHWVRLAENWTFSFSAHLFIHLFIYCCSDLPVQNVSDQLVSFPLCYRHPLWPYNFLNFAVYNGLLLLNCAEGLRCAHVLAEFDVGCHCVSVFIYCSNFKDTPVCAKKAFLQLMDEAMIRVS